MIRCPAGGIPPLSFAEDISTDEDDQTFSQGRHKKKGNKLLEKPDMGKGKGEVKAWDLQGLRRRGGQPSGAAGAFAGLGTSDHCLHKSLQSKSFAFMAEK